MTTDWIPYGEGASQFGVLHLPQTRPHGVVVVIHGGFWRAAYDHSLGTALAASLAAQGWAAWNLEYRRVGDGGGTPATFDDVAAGIDHLADLGLPLGCVVTLGHSAGGHLAAWAAARVEPRVTVTHVITQAAILDLRAAAALSDGAVEGLLGHPPTEADAEFDPIQQVPLGAPVWCMHGRQDDVVPISQSRDYVEAATSAGAEAELVEFEGDHFTVIDPTSAAWAQTLQILAGLVP